MCLATKSNLKMCVLGVLGVLSLYLARHGLICAGAKREPMLLVSSNHYSQSVHSLLLVFRQGYLVELRQNKVQVVLKAYCTHELKTRATVFLKEAEFLLPQS